MATLDKLAIRNIRSFDNNISVIQFYSPLTVIVGQNGSGKTTIIECLNYITTGDLPPNTKGGAFVHDPKIAQEKEVKAQVRLRFRDPKGEKYNVTRNLQVTTNKSGNLSMSTLEGLLQKESAQQDQVGGKRKRHAAISTKCASLEEEITGLLGVSTPILDNVIFCHQEDSNWPLSEPAKLKQKFDMIFDATKFTKALKHIKDLHKTRAADAKADKVRLESLKEDRDRAKKIRENKAKLEGDRLAKDAEIERLEERSRKTAAENRNLGDAYGKFREELTRAEAKQAEANAMRKDMERIKSKMTVIKESDEELAARRQDFNKHLDSQRAKSENFRQAILEKKATNQGLNDQYSRELTQKGQLQSKKEAYEQGMQERKKMVRDISNAVGIKGFDMEPLRESDVDAFITKLQSHVDGAEHAFEKLKKQLRKALSSLESKQAETAGDFKAKRIQRDNQSEANRKANIDIKRLEDDIADLNISEHDLQVAVKEVEELTIKLGHQREGLTQANYDECVRSLSVKLREAEENKDEASDELASLNKHADVRAQVAVLEKQVKAKNDALQNLLSKSNDIMRKVAGKEAAMGTLETEVDRLLRAKEGQLATARKSQQEADRALQACGFRLSSKRAELQKLENRISDGEAKITQELRKSDSNCDTILDLIAELEKQVNEIESKSNGAETMLQYLRTLKEGKEAKHECMTCHRVLEEEDEPVFDAQVKTLIDHFEYYKRPEAAEELEQHKASLEQAKLIRLEEQEIETLKGQDLVDVQRALQQEEAQRGSLTEAAESSADRVAELDSDFKELGVLKRNGSEAGRLTQEIERLESEVAQLQGDLQSAGKTRSSEEVQEYIAKLAEEIKIRKRELKSAQDERDAARSVHAQTERQLHQAELERRDQEQKLERSKVKLTELETLKKTLLDGKNAIMKLDADLIAAKKANSEAEDDLLARRDADDKRLSAETQKMNRLKAHHQHLIDAGKRLKNWEEKGGQKQLSDCEERMKQLKNKMNGVTAEITDLEEKKASVDADLQQARATERNIDDNIRYRELERDAEKIEETINEEELQKLATLYKDYESKWSEGRTRENEVNGNIQHLKGVVKGLRDQIKSVEGDLKDNYGNIDKRFTEHLIKFKTDELANADLDRTGKSIDAAILKYHSIKMEEINEHIRYLWTKTYQGTDIDTIMIKYDPDGSKSSKSYNYRVCMIKDTVEMDMRGRCSAGQKVLACIIIRLALADSFSTNCGILALDEPTTNLDKDNIDALAASLADLIKERSKTNFQLIVITHDEDFLGRLGQSDLIDYYWRVSRNGKQSSEITRHRLHA
ncbi:DNA repair protein rad50 [Tilletia horrida]|uniref:DNA repair protein RAD50 n=1 Tax=Tilletia horrida TaxID=155126 RepID=A0AAN6GTK0_9BASI|nr:DNA repair protein rad50 [Tilletia horrida]KAK0564563.1 DNA repair protein rad50 [Tilletia horrida]